VSDDGGSDSGDGQRGSGDDGERERSRAEQAVALVSVVFTVLLFAFLVWQALHVSASATPAAHVQSVDDLPGNRTGVTVVLANPVPEGLLLATVEVDCTQPPPSIDFTHVPTDGRETAVLVCPDGTTSNATANVTVWQTA